MALATLKLQSEITALNIIVNSYLDNRISEEPTATERTFSLIEVANAVNHQVDYTFTAVTIADVQAAVEAYCDANTITLTVL